MTDMIPAAKPIIGDEEREAVDRVLRSGMIAAGPEVAAFEQEFGEHLAGGRTCVAVNSGTAGLHLGLLAAGVGPGDEVIVPSFTFAATANSVALTGFITASKMFSAASGAQWLGSGRSITSSVCRSWASRPGYNDRLPAVARSREW